MSDGERCPGCPWSPERVRKLVLLLKELRADLAGLDKEVHDLGIRVSGGPEFGGDTYNAIRRSAERSWARMDDIDL